MRYIAVYVYLYADDHFGSLVFVHEIICIPILEDFDGRQESENVVTSIFRVFPFKAIFGKSAKTWEWGSMGLGGTVRGRVAAEM